MFKITNGLKEDFVGRFNGNDYKFPAGEPAYCEDDAAMHIFGIGQKDKTEILSRHGWATYASSIEEGMKKLNAFKFEHVNPKLDAPLALIDHGPAPVVQDDEDDEGATDGELEASSSVEEPEVVQEPPAPPKQRALPPSRSAAA